MCLPRRYRLLQACLLFRLYCPKGLSVAQCGLKRTLLFSQEGYQYWIWAFPLLHPPLLPTLLGLSSSHAASSWLARLIDRLLDYCHYVCRLPSHFHRLMNYRIQNWNYRTSFHALFVWSPLFKSLVRANILHLTGFFPGADFLTRTEDPTFKALPVTTDVGVDLATVFDISEADVTDIDGFAFSISKSLSFAFEPPPPSSSLSSYSSSSRSL
ncbi:hypothetical protein BCR41DRAFT_373446 [Lobosporangium transversale]|uniref:Uncharacterized protein n=1 Tax=Lobosporangium transversale TaxID=64571 RepID=A0A1Y2GFK9_9FUNG|nr:hypothetical protein BCR41DRAFT_373446 [Lobosporangium transversale]ORZ08055.1 hypothetical protein BCR41DRAFT_373446 [Lobosporangium transversale]|eukprot:XP_021878289.1 hypothetical protein BCR41DRAFT_373446 [Lobosporangium transversale]